MKLPFASRLTALMGRVVDERFLTHRRRSTSTAGVITALVALGLFTWRFYGDGQWSWDLFIVVAAFIAVKISLMIFYRLTD